MRRQVKGQRTYDSPRRREQAAATRHAILEAARGLFIERGYVSTTVDEIAERARTSPATVYATFRNKRSVLATLIDIAIAGDDAPVPILERPWVQALAAEPDRRRRARMLARHGTAILERRSPLDEVVAAAAATDPEIGALWRQMREQRHAGQRRLLELVAGGAGGFRAGLTLASASDLLYSLGSPEVWRLLVVDRGWSAARFERWYASAIEGLLTEG